MDCLFNNYSNYLFRQDWWLNQTEFQSEDEDSELPSADASQESSLGRDSVVGLCSEVEKDPSSNSDLNKYTNREEEMSQISHALNKKLTKEEEMFQLSHGLSKKLTKDDETFQTPLNKLKEAHSK